MSASTASATSTATEAVARSLSATILTSGRVLSWLITPAWEIGSSPYT